MLITKEHQEQLISNYIKEGHSTDECIGFIDGFQKSMEMVDNLNKKQH